MLHSILLSKTITKAHTYVWGSWGHQPCSQSALRIHVNWRLCRWLWILMDCEDLWWHPHVNFQESWQSTIPAPNRGYRDMARGSEMLLNVLTSILSLIELWSLLHLLLLYIQWHYFPVFAALFMGFDVFTFKSRDFNVIPKKHSTFYFISHSFHLLLSFKLIIIRSSSRIMEWFSHRKLHATADTNLGKSNKKQLMIGHSQGWQCGLLTILFNPVHVSLQSDKRSCYTQQSCMCYPHGNVYRYTRKKQELQLAC